MATDQNCRSRYTGSMAKKSNKKTSKGSASATIALNKKARHDYHLGDRFEAGLALEGWEVKSLRAGRVQLKEGFVGLDRGEAWLMGVNISALPTASTHIQPRPTRPRKLLLHREELNRMLGAVERKGFTVVPVALYWSKGRAKLEVALAKGKQAHDKRDSEKQRDWNREKARVLKHG